MQAGRLDLAFASPPGLASPSVDLRELATGAGFVRHQLGIAILPRLFVPADPALRIMSIKGHDLRWLLTLATCPAGEPTAAARALLGMLDGYLPEGRAGSRSKIDGNTAASDGRTQFRAS